MALLFTVISHTSEVAENTHLGLKCISSVVVKYLWYFPATYIFCLEGHACTISTSTPVKKIFIDLDVSLCETNRLRR